MLMMGVTFFVSCGEGIFLLDQFDRRKALIFVYSGFLIGTFACGLCDSYFSLVVVRFLTGIFGGLNGSLVYSIVSDTFPYKDRGKAMGGVMAGFSAAAALGVPLGLLVSYQLVWNYAFFFIALFGLPILMFVIFGFPPLTKHLKGETQLKAKQRISFIVKDRNQINALILGCVLVFGHMIIIPFIAPYMTRNIGFTDMQLILMYLIGGSVTVFSSPIFGKLTDRYGALRTYSIVLFASFIPTIWLTNLVTESILIALLATTSFFIFGSGRIISPQAMISAVISAETRGSFMSFKAALQQLAIFLAAMISGSIVQEAPDGTFSNYNIVGFISVGALLCTFLVAGKLRVAKGN